MTQSHVTEKNNPLVSIIIPCYNGERFLREAIDSCLAQTYRPIEIIVVDDGSTDGSLDILKSYGDAVIWETGPNRGPSHARNRGFELSQGEYIQYLDADDYILPEKLERQVDFLEKTGCDVVYGDWRVEHHNQDGTITFSDVVYGAHEDILEPLLGIWWLVVHSPLYRRTVVQAYGRWDDRIRGVEEKDFQLALALAGVSFYYVVGCGCVYRRYGPVTLSTASAAAWISNATALYEKAEARLAQSECLTDRDRRALAESYFMIAKLVYDTDRAHYPEALQKVFTVCPDYKSRQSMLYNVIQDVFGFTVAQWVAGKKRYMARKLGFKKGFL